MNRCPIRLLLLVAVLTLGRAHGMEAQYKAFVFVPLAAAAQPPVEKVHRVGRLSTGAAPAAPDPLLEAFRQGLRDLGYVEGRNIRIESRYAAGEEDRCPALAAELVRLPVDVLVAAGT